MILVPHSSRPVVLNQGPVFPPGYIWQCLETLMVVTNGGGGSAPGALRVEAREAAKHPQCPHTAPHNNERSRPASHINSAEVETA